jgi:hypothetical protein
LRDRHMIERCCEVGQGRSDDLLCLAGAERVPPLRFADEMGGLMRRWSKLRSRARARS